jgi:hypothetical protein
MDTVSLEGRIISKYGDIMHHELLKLIVPTKLVDCYNAWYRYSNLENKVVNVSYGSKLSALHCYITQILELLEENNQYVLVVALINAMGFLEEMLPLLSTIERQYINFSNSNILIDILVNQEPYKKEKVVEILNKLSRAGTDENVIKILIRYLDYDIEACAFKSSFIVDDSKIVLFNPNSGVNLDALLTHVYNGIIDRDILSQLKTLMFRIDDEIRYFDGFEIVKYSEIINSRRVLWFEGMRYTVREFLLIYLFIYSGIVNEEGPDVIIKDKNYYINTKNFKRKILIGPKEHEHDEIIKIFADNIVQYRFPDIKPDNVFTTDNLYKLYIRYCITFAAAKLDKIAFFKILSKYCIDVSNRKKGEIIVPPLYTLVKSNFSESNSICYYVFNGTSPKGTRKITSPDVQSPTEPYVIESRH